MPSLPLLIKNNDIIELEISFVEVNQAIKLNMLGRLDM